MNRIKRIEVENFKSFESLKVDLNPFNVLIGANASGKSNFTQIFKFIRDIANSGLDDAISMQGGVKYLRNIGIGSKKELRIAITYRTRFREIMGSFKNNDVAPGMDINSVIYSFSLKFPKRKSDFEVQEDKLLLDCSFALFKKDSKEKKHGIKVLEKFGDGKILISHTGGDINIGIKKPESVKIDEEDIFPSFLKRANIFNKKNLLLNTHFFFIPPLIDLFNVSIYDFDPRLSKRATLITGKKELEEDGSNLSIVIRNILQNNAKKTKLLNLISDLLPFIDELEIKNFEGKSLLFELKEKYFNKKYLPAYLLSDGTINITALITALYFSQKRSLTIIEEPERGIHPYLISRVVDIMKEVSNNKKQLIVTTHNPEMIKHLDIEDILLMKRDDSGYSQIIKPSNNETIKLFLKNNIGLDELYIQNLLEVQDD